MTGLAAVERRFQALSAIPHIAICCAFTPREPVADPTRIADALADALETPKSMWVLAASQPCAGVHRWGGRCDQPLAGPGDPVLGQSVRSAASTTARRRWRRCSAPCCTGEALLPAPTRSSPGHGAVPCADRGGPPPAGETARSRHRAGVADLCAGYPRRPRQVPIGPDYLAPDDRVRDPAGVLRPRQAASNSASA